VADDEKTVQNTKCERWDGEEVQRRNGLAMISEERQPSLHRIGISRGSPDPSRDSPFREIESQFKQFPVNARCSPARILGSHSENQVANFLRNVFPPTRSSHHRDSAPIERKSSPMPPNHSLWANDNEGLLPTRPKPVRENPEEPIEHVQPGPRVFALENGELLPENEIFQ
jgi:hypothetical protein